MRKKLKSVTDETLLTDVTAMIGSYLDETDSD